MTDSKARYSECCLKGYLPLHFQPWWLDAVCGPNGWKVAHASDKNGEIVGVLPYHTAHRWGLKVVQLPPLTTYAGPWLFYPQDVDFKEVSRLSFEKKVMSELIRQLPRTVFFKQNFRPEITNWLPFYWEGFRQTTRYTYFFEELNDLEKITAGFKNTLRSDLKKAEKYTELLRDEAAWPTVFELNKRSFQRKGRRQPYSLEAFKNLHKALNQRNQSACFVAYEKTSGRPSAGLYLVFDERQAAVLLIGTEPAFKSQCAIYSLLMEAIRFCAERTLSLDFEGSMDEGIEHSFRAFGGRLVPYFQITRYWLGHG
ncbi:MAG: GNAT family N-acetyltransferase [Saprospiraceae bacterium]